MPSGGSNVLGHIVATCVRAYQNKVCKAKFVPPYSPATLLRVPMVSGQSVVGLACFGVFGAPVNWRLEQNKKPSRFTIWRLFVSRVTAR